jgi:UDP-N-acetylmuramate dehydrogenase
MKTGDAQAPSLTSMRCGGRIAQLITVESLDELLRLLAGLNEYIILGGGYNIIFSDGLTLTPVIRLGEAFDTINADVSGMLYAGGGASIASIITICREKGLSGIEFMAGIPGTLGGTIRMNAGTNDKGIMDAVSFIDLADASGSRRIGKNDMDYGYRHTALPPKTVITGAGLSLNVTSPDDVRAKVASFIDRRRNQPNGLSSGCIFKNPEEGSSAGLLIDKAGLKGCRVGGAFVSEIHANFIINDGSASSSDILKLIGVIKDEVKKQFSVELKEEVIILA